VTRAGIPDHHKLSRTVTMAVWTSTGRGAYTRSLGLSELGFYYDGHINGTADTITHTTIHVSPDAPNCADRENIVRSWFFLKAQFPLLGATLQMYNALPQFVVTAARLKTPIPGEISCFSVSSAEEAHAVAVDAMNSQRKLSDNLLSRILVLSRTDSDDTYHVLINTAHLITDGIGNVSLLKGFLDLLALDKNVVPNLGTRLSLAVAAESLVPTLKMSVARQRWRRAAGHVISKLQDAKRTARATHYT
jgi:hypothetical protein